MLTQENLDRSHTETNKLSLVLFDEIEKASDSLWQLLLGILDKATLTLGDNRRVNFSRSIVPSSNLGAREMSELISGGIGFAPKSGVVNAEVNQKIYRTALEAAKRKFSPEFMNRINKVVVFRSLHSEHLTEILEIELRAVQRRITEGTGEKFVFKCSQAAKDFLLEEGIDFKYGARHLKRSIERFLVYPLSNLIATNQVGMGDLLIVDYSPEIGKLVFSKDAGGALIHEEYHQHVFPDRGEPEMSSAIASQRLNGPPRPPWRRKNNPGSRIESEDRLKREDAILILDPHSPFDPLHNSRNDLHRGFHRNHLEQLFYLLIFKRDASQRPIPNQSE